MRKAGGYGPAARQWCDTVVGRIAVFNAADAAWRAACGDMVRLRDEMREQLAAGLEH
jgi:hypothetical protein